MPPALLYGMLLIGGSAAILAGAALGYHWYLDYVEDWNPWAKPVAMVVGRHRLGTVIDPYRMPGWTWSRRLPKLGELLPIHHPADTYREPEEGEIRELSTID